MQKRSVIDVSDYRAVDTMTLQGMLSSGRKTAVEIGEAAGAKIKVGRRTLWNVSKIQNYLDEISG